MKPNFIALLTVAFIFGCSKKSNDSASDGRTVHDDQSGYMLSHLSDWKVSFEKGAYIQVASPDSKSRAIIFPFFSTQSLTATNCLTKVPQVFSDIMPSATIQNPKQAKKQPDEAVAGYSHSKGDAAALCSIEGRSGVLFLGVTAKSDKKSAAEITNIFRSLKFTEPKKNSTNTSGLNLKDWVDPQEKAFRTKVPEGWQVEGGMFRFAPVDVRIYLKMTSADGKIIAVVGDKQMPPLVTPDLGGPEGGTYNPGTGTLMYSKRFLSGGDFSAEYLTNAANVIGCPNEQAKGNELVEFTNRLQEQANQSAASGVRLVASAGDARMSCVKDGEDRVGYIFTTTSLTTMSATENSGTWSAFPSGYASPKSRESEAKNAVAAAYMNFQYEPEWYKAQQNITAATSQIVAQTNADIAAIYAGSNTNTQASMDRIFRNWSNATLGQTDVVDASTGETYKVASGKNYYWRKNGTNLGSGTNTYDRPDIDFTPLTEY